VLHKWTEVENFVWLVSEDILNEYKDVLRRLRVRSHLTGRVVNLIRERGEEIQTRHSTGISPDPGDDSFCLCAEQGQADFIVTLNAKDFAQDRLNATVVLPARMIELC
jgi:predicted nucleic acid-binding protein